MSTLIRAVIGVVAPVTLVSLIAGCTPVATTSATSPTSPSVMGQTGKTWVEPITIASDFTCQPPSSGVMDWISQNYNGGRSYPPDGVVMVKVGQGTYSGETWWIVAWQMESREDDSPLTYLTNMPDPAKPSGETWVSVSTEGYWPGTYWDLDTIAQGKVALATAVSCIPVK